MTDSSFIDALAVARELIDRADIAYPIYGSIETGAARVTLPDGRVASLAIVYDEDSGIGEWIDRNGKRESHHDDIFGTFVFRGRDSDTGRPSARPSDFTGAARVFTRYGQGSDRIDGSVWWQPPADVLDQSNAAEVVESLAKSIDSYLSGDWCHVGLVVTITADGEEVGAASLWGVEWGLDDPTGSHADYVRGIVAENLEESGIGKASTAGVARWARDPLEAVARRMSGEDPEDGDAPAYHDALAALLTWWRETVESAGDWDAYGERLANCIESDFADHLRRPDSSRPGRSLGVSHGDDCTFCQHGAHPLAPFHHRPDTCPRKPANLEA